MNFFRNMPAESGGPSLIDIEQETEQEYWPAEQIVQSGRAAVTFYASALQPDDAAQYPGPLAKLLGSVQMHCLPMHGEPWTSGPLG